MIDYSIARKEELAKYTENLLHKLRAKTISLNFSKKHSSSGIEVNPYIEGPAVYYQGGTVKASINEIYFRKMDNTEMTISDVPDVFYSEVMSDMDYLINAL
jgi:hypothetical protein